MRDYKLWIPEDAVAAETPERRRWALEIVRQSMGAETRPTSKLSLAQWRRLKAHKASGANAASGSANLPS